MSAPPEPQREWLSPTVSGLSRRSSRRIGLVGLCRGLHASRRGHRPRQEHFRTSAGSPKLSANSATSTEKGSRKRWLGSLFVAPLMIVALILESLLQQGDFDAEIRDR